MNKAFWFHKPSSDYFERKKPINVLYPIQGIFSVQDKLLAPKELSVFGLIYLPAIRVPGFIAKDDTNRVQIEILTNETLSRSIPQPRFKTKQSQTRKHWN